MGGNDSNNIDKIKKPTRIVVMGDLNVGKSALITRCIKNIYNKQPTSPSGKDISYRYNDYFGKKDITLDIVDFNGKNDALITCADGIIICYSITNRQSFEAIDNYLDMIVESHVKHPKITIIANKSDLYNQRQVSSNEGFQLAKEINALFYETSAKIPVIDMRQVVFDLYKTIKNAKKQRKNGGHSYDSYEVDSNEALSMLNQSIINTTGLFGYSRCCSQPTKGYFSGIKEFSRRAISTRSRRFSRDSSI